MHTSVFHLQQPQQHQQHQQKHQQQQVLTSVISTDATYTAHVLNTIAEEGVEEDKSCPLTAIAINEKDNRSDSECEVTVTVTLPTRKIEKNKMEEVTSNSPVDFWQQINDDDELEKKETIATDAAETSESKLYDKDSESVSSTMADSVSYENVAIDAYSKSLSVCFDNTESSEDVDTDVSEKSSLTSSVDSESSEDAAVFDESEKSSSMSDTAIDDDADVTSEISESSEEDVTPSPSQSDNGCTSAKDAMLRPLSQTSSAMYLLDVMISERDGRRRKNEEDADSGITTWSADISRQISEKDVQNGIGGGIAGTTAKKYRRTGTHSRLFDFLQRDDYNGSAATGGIINKSLQLSTTVDLPSSCTSGYSSAATTPTTPSVSGARGRYESDSARAEYDSYYNSWEYACPYFGYDILPSKAFKTIAQQQGRSSTAIIKCPKIPTGENKS